MNPQIVFFLILSFLVYDAMAANTEVLAYPPQISNFTSSNAFVTPDRIFTIGCIVNDLDRKESLVNCSVELSSGAVFLWQNKSDVFSLIRNPNNFVRMEYGSYSEIVNSSARALNFKLSYRVNMTHGPVDVLSSGTRVYDNSSAYSHGNYTALFQIVPAPEGWQTNPSDIPQSGRALKPGEAAIILVSSLIVIAVLSLFASRHKKSTQERYRERIDVHPKRRDE